MATIFIEPHTVNDGVLRLAISGEVDLSTCDVLGASIRDAVTDGHVAELVVDLDGVTFLDSTGVAALVDGHNLAAEQGVAYVVTDANKLIHDVLDTSGVLPVLGEGL